MFSLTRRFTHIFSRRTIMGKEAKNAVYNIVAFVFADPKKAMAVHDELKASKSEAKEQDYKIVANAVVEVDDKGKAHIHEGGHGGWGAVAGVAVGGALSLLGGPIGLLAWVVAGGVIGGFAGKIGGRAVPKEDLEKMAAQMKPNTSAILVIIEDKGAEQLINRMSPYKAQVVTLTVGDETSGEIAEAVAAEVEVTPPPATPAAAAAPAAPAAPAAEKKA
jgi:uncharacterized membrane protein